MIGRPTANQRDILRADEDLLVVGGPGSGKTTVALEKARRFTAGRDMGGSNKVLFLSFSNAAVRRIQEAARIAFAVEERRTIVVSTFHAFCHDVLTSHWRLVGLDAPLAPLLPEDERVLETQVGEPGELEAALTTLEYAGRVRFDRYAPLVVELFARAATLRTAYASAYPLIIVDEYQDTDDDQHALVGALARPGQLVCCGDPDQRIYEFRPGTRDDRVDQAEREFGLRRITLRSNHRSGAGDISRVANAILKGEERIPRPTRVAVREYYRDTQMAEVIKQSILNLQRAIRRHTGEQDRQVSIAIMGFRNVFVGKISRLLLEPSGPFDQPFRHRVLLRQEEVTLAWQAVAAVFAPGLSVTARTVSVLEIAARQNRVEAGDSASPIRDAERLERWARDLARGDLGGNVRGVHYLIDRIGGLVSTWTGDAAEDAARITQVFRAMPGNHLRRVVRVVNLRPFGTPSSNLLTDLAEAYLATGEYVGVAEATQQELLQEWLVGEGDTGGGRVLMTLHKCKGREFDAAIIVDGRYGDSVVLPSERGRAEQPESRRLLATSIMRARFATILITNGAERCPLIPIFE